MQGPQLFGRQVMHMTSGHLLCGSNRSFSLSRDKKVNWKPPSEKSQENECYKTLIYKQFVQVSGSLWPTVSELFAETFHASL